MQISIFGLGYVGCVSAARMAEAGHQVVGVDVNTDKTTMVNSGSSPIVEPGLGELLADGVAAGRLRATNNVAEAVKGSELAFVCVGTPGYPNGQLNVDTLRRVCQEIGTALRHNRHPYTVVIRSTMLPGTMENVVAPALHAAAGNGAHVEIHLAVNPEFMREGTALDDYQHPPLTLIGCDRPDTASLLRAAYAGVDAPFVHTDVKTAEMVKYVANAFHAAKICFANEIGDVCEALGADPQEVMRIFRIDRKLNISETYLRPGFAFGGSCLPKDLRALAYAAHHADVPTPMLSTILPSNEWQIHRAVDRVLATRKRKVGIVGLAFKPGTDDLRESPTVSLAETLLGKGCDVRILDHNVSVARLTGANRRYIEEEIPHIASLMCESPKELAAHAEVLVICNDGTEMRQVIAAAHSEQTIIDLTRSSVPHLESAVEEKSCRKSDSVRLPLHSQSPSPVLHS